MCLPEGLVLSYKLYSDITFIMISTIRKLKCTAFIAFTSAVIYSLTTNIRQTDKQTDVIKPDDQATQHYLIVGECSKEQPVLQ